MNELWIDVRNFSAFNFEKNITNNNIWLNMKPFKKMQYIFRNNGFLPSHPWAWTNVTYFSAVKGKFQRWACACIIIHASMTSETLREAALFLLDTLPTLAYRALNYKVKYDNLGVNFWFMFQPIFLGEILSNNSFNNFDLIVRLEATEREDWSFSSSCDVEVNIS